MNIDTCYKIGFIMKPHGLKGEVTISLDPEAPEDFSSVETIFVAVGERLLPYFIQAISLKGSKAFLKLEDVNTAEEAQDISKSALYLPKSSRPKSGRGEFYDDEVIGFDVEDTAVGLLGKITDIVQAGPNKLLSVDFQGKEVLVPLNSPFIGSINKSRKKITVTLPDGFLDI
ncbi:MAG TPA: ribosome maturation factor RimM [Chryseosolibacter sp.]|nr:ribosome maturation factor RimM [Chryseosolibacter sp.]